MPPSQAPISTPPGSTLSTPSPTEFHDKDPIAAEAEKFAMSSSASTGAQRLKYIYLVVATTPCKNGRLGIGLNGKLPWPMIRADMNYFKKVTRDGSSTGTPNGTDPQNIDKVSNCVIMGRKTYESIPPKFRPLGDRTNVIITRSKPMSVAKGILSDLEKQTSEIKQKKDELERKQAIDPTSAVAQQLKMADAEFNIIGDDRSQTVAVKSESEGLIPGVIVESNLRSAAEHYLSRPGEVYCIGGAEIYNALLKDDHLRRRLRLLQTEIQKVVEGEEFECDTFWPEDLDDSKNGWSEVGAREVSKWTGVDTPQGLLMDWVDDEKVDVRLRVRGWEQKRP